MLEIEYIKEGTQVDTTFYDKVSDFLDDQEKEVPVLEDYYQITKASIEGVPLKLNDSTVVGLYNQLKNN
jgi:hypothetical protein